MTRAEMRAHFRALAVGDYLALQTAMGHPNAQDRVHVNLQHAVRRVPGRFSVRLDKDNRETRATRISL